MNISPSKAIPDKSPLFIALPEKASVLRHALVKNLTPEDREYLAVFEKQSSVSRDSTKSLILPSGRKMILFGIGDSNKPARQQGGFTHRKAILLMRKMVVVAKSEKLKSFAVWFPDFRSRGVLTPADTAVQMALQFSIAEFDYQVYKEKPKEGWPKIEDITVVNPLSNARFAKLLAEGSIIGEEINKTRSLSNTPGADMTPQVLADAAITAGKECGFTVKVFDEKDIEKLGMGGVMGVSRGSPERPRFIIMEYMKGPKGKAPVVLVGKGVTFDTGGLNLKPSNSLYEMHMDMSGGAAVIHTIAALARMKVKRSIIGLVPAVENAISGSSYHPGDVLKAMNGRTIEVMDTDAEGRIILADALCYAARYKPSLVIDIATLTGAAVVALGQRASAMFTKYEDISRQLVNAGEATGDFLWPLPLWEEYENEIKGTFGDFANVSKIRWGGAITGAAFLWQFVKDAEGLDAYHWVHLDIAPRMTTIEGEFLSRGAAGAPVAALVKFLMG
jgi:leucyl aminopeptidase